MPENGVRDGDLLLLSTEDPTSAPAFSDLSHYVVDSSTPMGTRWRRRLGECAWLWSAILGAVTLGWPTHVAQGYRAMAAAFIAVAAAVSTVIADRIGIESSVTLSIGVTSAAFGALAGYLMVPGGPTPSNFVLAAAICATVSTVLLHAAPGGLTLLTAILSFSLMVAIAAACATIWPIPTVAIGCFLAAASLAMLSFAAKVSILVAGLSPRTPTVGDRPDDHAIVPASVGMSKATRGHTVLTGLMAGISWAAALGAALVVVDERGTSAWVRAAFAVTVSVALMFRACRQRGAARSTSVLLAGFVCLTAAFTSMVAAAPEHAAWACLLAVALGASVLCLTRAELESRLTPLTRRALETVEYLALAAVMPIACWMAGVFDFVRGLSLT